MSEIPSLERHGMHEEDVKFEILKQDQRINLSCAYSILKGIITSYAGQEGSINPSKNY